MITAVRVLAIGNVYPPHDFGGGYEDVWRSAMSDLRARGHEVRVLCSDHRAEDAGPELDPDVHRSLRWYWRDGEFPRPSLRECRRIELHNAAALDAAIGDFAPDVVSWWGMGALSMSLLGRVARRSLPAVAFVSDDWLIYGPKVDGWARRLRRRPSGRGVRFVFVSGHVRVRARAVNGSIGDDTVAHTGIRDSLLDGASEARGWRWRLLCLGRVEPRKGLATAVDSLAQLPDEAILTIVGDGSDRDVAGLREQIARLGLDERVELAGRVAPDAVGTFYDSCDAVLFPVTWAEPWGLVPLEAMARMRPVVATGSGGSGEYLADEENCLLFGGGDAPALAAAVQRLAGDSALRERLVAQGRSTAERYTMSAFNAVVAEELERAAG